MAHDLIELETERLVLRPGRTDDVPAIIRFFEDNAERFRPTDPVRPADFLTDELWRTRIEEMEAMWRDDRAYRLFLFARRDPARVIGFVQFSNVVRGVFHACYLGYAIDGEHEGQGLMSEALRRAITYAFDELHLHRIMANYLPGNTRSAVLLARLGFVAEGYARDYLRIAGRWQDHVLTALRNDRWSDPS